MSEKIFSIGDDVLIVSGPDTGEVKAEAKEDFYFEVMNDSTQSVNDHHVEDLVQIPCVHRIRKSGFELKIEATVIEGKRQMKARAYRGGRGRPTGGRIRNV